MSIFPSGLPENIINQILHSSNIFTWSYIEDIYLINKQLFPLYNIWPINYKSEYVSWRKKKILSLKNIYIAIHSSLYVIAKSKKDQMV
jgi:hypothetical protein